jgi:hypothetical protein
MIAFVLATAAMLLTHYLTLFVLAVEILIVIIVAVRSSRLMHWATPLAFVIMLATIALLYGLSVAPPPTPQAGFSFIPLPVLLRDVLNSFSLGLSVNVEDVIIVDLLFLLVVLTGLLASGKSSRQPPLPAALILLLYLALPLALTYLAGYVRPIYMNSRHLIVITPAFYLALGAGLDQLAERRGVFFMTLGVLLIGIVYSWSQYFGNSIYHKDDHRAWGDYLRANVQPGDVVVVNPPHIYDLYNHYAASDVPWIGLPLLGGATAEETSAALDRLATQYRNIWLALSYTPPWGDPDRLVEKWLDRTLTKTDERSFRSYASIVRLARYATRPPTAISPPPISSPSDLELGGKLRFMGFDVVNRQAEPGRSLAYSIYVQTIAPTDGEVKISLRLLDEKGRLWAQSDQTVGALQSLSRWREGMIVREDANLFIPLATPPGAYRVEMVVYVATTGQPLFPASREGLPLGEAAVARPRAYPAPEALPITRRAYSCAGPISLVGLRLPQGQIYEGGVLTFDAYWQANQAPEAEYLVKIELVNSSGAVQVEQTSAIATQAHGTLTWEPGEVVRGQYALALRRDLPPGAYRLRFTLNNTATGAALPLQRCGLARLAPFVSDPEIPILIAGRPRVYAPPDVMFALPARLDNRIALLGFDIEGGQPDPAMRPGQSISVTVYLQAVDVMDAAYTVFIHFVGDDEVIWGQQDRPAGGATHPTTLWLPGEVVSTTLSVGLSSQTPTARLTAYMGLYDATTNARLPLSGVAPSEDRVRLFVINVAR